MSVPNAFVNLDYVLGHSLGASFNAPAVSLQYFQGAAFQLIWTGSPTGQFQVAGSIDGVNFDPLLMNPILTSGTAGSGIFDVTFTQCPFLQIQWVYSIILA
jgi:hypothetical protein